MEIEWRNDGSEEGAEELRAMVRSSLADQAVYAAFSGDRDWLVGELLETAAGDVPYEQEFWEEVIVKAHAAMSARGPQVALLLLEEVKHRWDMGVLPYAGAVMAAGSLGLGEGAPAGATWGEVWGQMAAGRQGARVACAFFAALAFGGGYPALGMASLVRELDTAAVKADPEGSDRAVAARGRLYEEPEEES